MARLPIADPGAQPVIFGLRTPWHMLIKLGWEIRHLREERHWHGLATSFHAFNCAVTAWHLADWTFEAMDDAHRVAVFQDNLGVFKEWLKHDDPEWGICAEIANCSKHRRQRNVPDTSVHTEWEDDPDPEVLYRVTPVILHQGVRHVAADMFHRVADAWHHRLADFDLAEAPMIVGREPELDEG